MEQKKPGGLLVWARLLRGMAARNRNRLKKLVLTGLPLLLAAVYLFFVLQCLPDALHIQAVSRQSIGFGQVLSENRIDLESRILDASSYDYYGVLLSHTEGRFSEARQLRLRIACAFALVPLWKDQYINPNVYDGGQWRMTIVYEDREQSICGSNAHPPLYWLAAREIRSLYQSVEKAQKTG